MRQEKTGLFYQLQNQKEFENNLSDIDRIKAIWEAQIHERESKVLKNFRHFDNMLKNGKNIHRYSTTKVDKRGVQVTVGLATMDILDDFFNDEFYKIRNMLEYKERWTNITRTAGNYDSSDTIDDEVWLFDEVSYENGRKIRTVLLRRKNTYILQRRYYIKVGQAINPDGIWRFDARENLYKGRVPNPEYLDNILKNTL